MPTEDDWKLRMAQRAKEAMRERPINEKLLRYAAVQSELLTGHPSWDVYLQKLQVLLEESESELKSWQEKLPTAYSEADLRLVQLKVHVFTECVALLRHVMSLPVEIMSHAQEVGHDER